VPEHQEFGILGQLTPGQRHQAVEQAAREEVAHRDDHSAMISAYKPGQARSNNRAPTGSGDADELLDRTLIWNQAHLRQIPRQYETHHNQHRPHRSLHAAVPLKPLPGPADSSRSTVSEETLASLA